MKKNYTTPIIRVMHVSIEKSLMVPASPNDQTDEVLSREQSMDEFDDEEPSYARTKGHDQWDDEEEWE